MRVFALLAVAFLPACSDVLQEDQIDGPYSVEAVDSVEYRMVRYRTGSGSVGIVGPTVIGVGSDDRYVVVAQAPLQDDIRSKNAFFNSTDPATGFAGTAYYIIDRAADHRFADQPNCACKKGPLKAEDYEREVVRLNLPRIDYY